MLACDNQQNPVKTNANANENIYCDQPIKITQVINIICSTKKAHTYAIYSNGKANIRKKRETITPHVMSFFYGVFVFVDKWQME